MDALHNVLHSHADHELCLWIAACALCVLVVGLVAEIRERREERAVRKHLGAWPSEATHFVLPRNGRE